MANLRIFFILCSAILIHKLHLKIRLKSSPLYKDSLLKSSFISLLVCLLGGQSLAGVDKPSSVVIKWYIGSKRKICSGLFIQEEMFDLI